MWHLVNGALREDTTEEELLELTRVSAVSEHFTFVGVRAMRGCVEPSLVQIVHSLALSLSLLPDLKTPDAVDRRCCFIFLFPSHRGPSLMIERAL